MRMFPRRPAAAAVPPPPQPQRRVGYLVTVSRLPREVGEDGMERRALAVARKFFGPGSNLEITDSYVIARDRYGTETADIVVWAVPQAHREAGTARRPQAPGAAA